MEIFVFCVITFEPIKIYTRYAPQNDSLSFSFVKYIKIIVKEILDTTLFLSKKKGMTMSIFLSD